MDSETIDRLAEFIKDIDSCGNVCELMTCLNYNTCKECVIDYLKENLGIQEEN